MGNMGQWQAPVCVFGVEKGGVDPALILKMSVDGSNKFFRHAVHAELRIGNSMLMIGEAGDELGVDPGAVVRTDGLQELVLADGFELAPFVFVCEDQCAQSASVELTLITQNVATESAHQFFESGLTGWTTNAEAGIKTDTPDAFEGSDEARSLCYVDAWHRYHSGAPDGFLWGRYLHRYRRTDTGWRITSLLLQGAGTIDFHRERTHGIGRN